MKTGKAITVLAIAAGAAYGGWLLYKRWSLTPAEQHAADDWQKLVSFKPNISTDIDMNLVAQVGASIPRIPT